GGPTCSRAQPLWSATVVKWQGQTDGYHFSNHGYRSPTYKYRYSTQSCQSPNHGTRDSGSYISTWVWHPACFCTERDPDLSSMRHPGHTSESRLHTRTESLASGGHRWAGAIDSPSTIHHKHSGPSGQTSVRADRLAI